MRSTVHLAHVKARTAYNDCSECRADCERRFLDRRWPGYLLARDYLEYSRMRLDAIRGGDDSVEARVWHREWLEALHRRITLKAGDEVGRKRCASYLQRLGQFRTWTSCECRYGCDAAYLRRFAKRGASAL